MSTLEQVATPLKPQREQDVSETGGDTWKKTVHVHQLTLSL